jgi:hypothetical protein
LSLRQLRKRFQPRALQFAPTPVVNQQAIGDGAKIGSRFPNLAGLTMQQADEYVLRHVCRFAGIAELATQPSLQPAMVVGVELVYMRLSGGFCGSHR